MRKILAMVALLLVSAIAVNAQTVVVQGRVSDENGPVPNATVQEKGTKNSVTAEANGTFTIRVKQGAKLIITAVGFETTEVDASSTYMNISVKIKADELQEVLVTSAFGVKKSQRTTAFSSQVINAEQLTVIRQPAEEMGRAATELLLQLVESKRPVKDFEKRVLTPELQIRGSAIKL